MPTVHQWNSTTRNQGTETTHRPIVDKSDLHHGLKNTILNLCRSIKFLDMTQEMIIELFRFVRFGGSMEVRLVAFLRGSVEREL